MLYSELKLGMPVRVLTISKRFADDSPIFYRFTVTGLNWDGIPNLIEFTSYGVNKQHELVDGNSVYFQDYKYDPYGKLCYELRSFIVGRRQKLINEGKVKKPFGWVSFADNINLAMSTQTYDRLLEDAKECKILANSKTKNDAFSILKIANIIPLLIMDDSACPILSSDFNGQYGQDYHMENVKLDESMPIGIVNIGGQDDRY